MKTVPLGVLVRISGGGTPSKSESLFWNGSIPWASVKDLKGLELTSTQDHISELGARKIGPIVPAGTVITSTRMAVGKSAMNSVPMAINQDLKALHCKPDLHPRYLLHFLNSKKVWFEKQGKGATVKGITLDVLINLAVPLPSLDEQRRIADILDRADALKRKRQHALQLADEFLRAAFLDIFGDLTPQGEDVESLLASANGAIRTGPFGSQLLHSEFVDDGIPVLGIDNVVQNVFQWAKPRFITVEKYHQLRRYQVYPGDVLITIMGTCGRCAIVPEEVGPCINTKHLCCITLDQSRCLPEYLHSYFRFHPSALAHLSRATKGAIMDGLNMEIIRSMPVAVPSLDLQDRFRMIRKSALELNACLGQTDSMLHTLNSTIFPDLLHGPR